MTRYIPKQTFFVLIGFYILLTAWWTPIHGEESARLEDDIQTQIRRRILSLAQENGFVCSGELICGVELLPLFYAQRDYRPVWIDQTGLRANGLMLIQAIRDSSEEGLQPQDYHLSAIDRLLDAQNLRQASQAPVWADLDQLMTDAFLLLASHLAGGRVNPESLHTDWVITNRLVDLSSILKNALQEDNLTDALKKLQPPHPDFQRLRETRRRLLDLARQGGWPQLPPGKTMGVGEIDARVPLLRQRLMASGDLTGPPEYASPQVFTPETEAAVKKFQRRHGLTDDGFVGKRTLTVLNIPVESRIRTIELNMERWRWLPADLGRRYIWVNAADFNLKVVENQTTVLSMRAVVGRPVRRTPVFSSRMTYLVLNPYWTVPDIIAKQDMLPRLLENTDFLINQGIKVFKDWSEASEQIDPQSVDWSLYKDIALPFRLRQDPGPQNALGRIKFLFPNKFAVYLHDTPNRTLFDRTQRDFSSGCIRVQDALSLALYLLSNDPKWSRDYLGQLLAENKQQFVKLPEPIAIHLLYITAWVDDDGELQFREDIYNRDRTLDRALKARPPSAPRKQS